MRYFARPIRMLSATTLFFFCWTFLPMYAVVAYAVEKSRATSSGHRQQSNTKRIVSSGEQLENAIDSLRTHVDRAEEMATRGETADQEIKLVKARKAEIDAIDIELRREFIDTEKKLRDANLPKEILDRHNNFIRNYEDNLAELKANVDAIEKAKTPSALTAELTKTRKHLDEVKPAKKHKHLDPNKLPNRIVKAKERQPKLKNEEWEKELPRGKSKKEPKRSRAAQWQQQKPTLVASNGSLAGLLSGTESFALSSPSEEYLQLAELSMDGLILTAQTGSYGKHPFPPEIYPLPWNTDMTPEDKLETPETHVTDAIRAKAAELQNNPILMFNWLRNNIYLVPSYGSIQGADMCLQTKQCNATDIASLTIAMFRAADWPARYEFLTAELDIVRFMENMGSFTDPQAAITFAATGGIPVRPVITGGKITSVQFEHVYATALLPMGYYIGVGSLMRKGWSEPMWMPLDVSLKHYVTTPGIDMNLAVPFDAQAFVNQIQSTATINESEGYVTNVNSALIQQTMQDYQTRVQNFISQVTPTAAIGDVIGKREIKQHALPHLYPTGWTKAVTAPIQSHTLPDIMKYKVSFILQDADTLENSITFSSSIAEIAGKRITLSYAPATAIDEQVINHYGGIFNVPAYLINVKPQIRLEGDVAATGKATGLGKGQAFDMQFISAAYGTEIVSNIVTAGAYYGIGINTNTVSETLLPERRAKLAAVKDTICINNPYSDDCAGELLYTTAMGYFYVLQGSESITAKSNNIVKMKDVSEAIASAQVDVSQIFGVPKSVSETGMMIDVDRNIYVAASSDGDQTKIRPFTLSVGQMSSAMEHQIFEIMYQAKGISTVQAIKLAIEQNVPIYTITQNNISSVLPALQISSEVKNAIQAATNAGKTVITPKQNITYYTWTGSGYMIIDPQTNAAAYMISTNLAGGGQCIAAGGFSEILLAQAGSSTPSSPASPAACNVTSNPNSVQSAFNVWCFGGVMFVPVVAAMVYAAWSNLPLVYASFIALGPFGGLLVAAYILMTVALIAALVFWAYSCYETLITKDDREYRQFVLANLKETNG